MKAPIFWTAIAFVAVCLCGIRMPTTLVVAQEDEDVAIDDLEEAGFEQLERRLDELHEEIEQAEADGKKDLARELRGNAERILDRLERLEREREGDDEEEEEREGFERELRELEMHRQELEIRRANLELEVADFELRSKRFKWLIDETATAIQAIEMTGHFLEEDEAVEFLGEMLDESSDAVVKRFLRQRLVELSLELDRREEAKAQLRALILHDGAN